MNTQHLDNEIDKTIQILKKGGVILYPTDTIWGIGCDATNSKAVEKIYKIKQRFTLQFLRRRCGLPNNFPKNNGYGYFKNSLPI